MSAAAASIVQEYLYISKLIIYKFTDHEYLKFQVKNVSASAMKVDQSEIYSYTFCIGTRTVYGQLKKFCWNCA